jgi:hypothetical protein
MTTSKTIAALLGPTFVATAVMVLVNLDAMPTIIEELSKSPMLIVLAGYAAFVPGVAVVLRPISAYSDGQMIIRTPGSGPV